LTTSSRIGSKIEADYGSFPLAWQWVSFSWGEVLNLIANLFSNHWFSWRKKNVVIDNENVKKNPNRRRSAMFVTIKATPGEKQIRNFGC